MKRIVSFILSVLFIFGMGISVSAEDVIKGEDFFYTVNNGKITIVSVVDLEKTDVVIPEEIDGYPVTVIGENAFMKNYAVESVIIPDSVEIIGNSAFLECYSLESIKIGSGIKSIGDYAFYDCNSLEKVSISDVAAWCSVDLGIGFSNPISGRSLYVNDVLTENLVIPEGVTEIKSFAFQSCQSLLSVSIPNSVKVIGENAFSDSYTLKNVTMGDGVEIIKDYAFNFCENLAFLKLSSNLKTLDTAAFRGCRSLNNVIIPEGATSIGNEAFSGCNELENIIIPDTVELIGENAFYGAKCNNKWENNAVYIGNHLIQTHSEAEGSFVVREGTLTIAEYAFYNSPKIEAITLPISLKNINGYAFYGSKIKTVHYRLDETAKDNLNIIENGNETLLEADWDYDSCIGNASHNYKYYSGVMYCEVCFNSSTSAGDLTGDTYINTSDLATMKLLLADGSNFIEFVKFLADFNGDSIINTSDLAAMKLYLAGGN